MICQETCLKLTNSTQEISSFHPGNEYYETIRDPWHLLSVCLWGHMKQVSAWIGNVAANVLVEAETLLIWSNWNLFILYRECGGALSGYFRTWGIVWFNKRPISTSDCWIWFFSIAPFQSFPSYCMKDCVTSAALASSWKTFRPSPSKWLLFPAKPNLKHFRFHCCLGTKE